MITTRYYLDCRVAEGEAPLKLCIRRNGAGAYLATGIRLLPSQWDNKAQKVTAHPHKNALNSFLTGFKFKVDSYLRELTLSGSAVGLSPSQLRVLCVEQFEGKRDTTLLRDYLFSVCKNLSRSSKGLYMCVWNAVRGYDRYAESRLLSSCDKRWVNGFAEWLEGQGLKPNTRSTYLAKVKAVFASAVKDGNLKNDPTQGINTAFVATRRRNLSAAQMRLFLNAPVSSELEQKTIDFFALSFYLRAANPIDIVKMTTSNIYNGRIEYDRSKTGRHYSVRIEPEAQAIIDRNTDGTHLFTIPPNYRSPSSFFTSLYDVIVRLSSSLGLPKVSLYWARHPFASLAFELGYGMDLVSAALGHSLGGAPITSVYVAVQDKQVDDLARAVYDYVKNTTGSLNPSNPDRKPIGDEIKP